MACTMCQGRGQWRSVVASIPFTIIAPVPEMSGNFFSFFAGSGLLVFFLPAPQPKPGFVPAVSVGHRQWMESCFDQSLLA